MQSAKCKIIFDKRCKIDFGEVVQRVYKTVVQEPLST